MSDFKNLHPVCIFSYFVVVIGMILVCNDPLLMVIACAGAALLLGTTEKSGIKKHIKWMLPLLILIAIANPLVNHRGVTRLFVLFDQWITLEAVCYGVSSALSLAAVILWFCCYQKIMTSDKFLYIFGKIAPACALLVSMALAFVPKLQKQLEQILECRQMMPLQEENRLKDKIYTAIRNVSILLGWSLENTVEQADSMKARGYGIKKRTAFHLFRIRRRDVIFLAVLLVETGICLGLRILGYGTMEFYPRIVDTFSGKWNGLFYLTFLLLAVLPGIMEWKEEMVWRSYNLNP